MNFKSRDEIVLVLLIRVFSCCICCRSQTLMTMSPWQDKVSRQHAGLTRVHPVLCDEDLLLTPSGATEQDRSELPRTRPRSDSAESGRETETQRETQCVWKR